MPGFIDASKSDFDTLVELNANFTDGTVLDDSGDPRDPNAHAASHATAGADALAAADIGAEAAGATATHNASASAHGGAEALAASALQPGDIVWTGEAIATELIASGDGDTVLTAQLTNTPSGPVICHYEGTTMVEGAGEGFTISGKQITWLESVGGSGTAPPMAVGENLWFFYGSTGLALGTAAYVAATSLLSAPVAPYFVSGGVPVAKAAGVTVNGLTDDLDQLAFHADWTVDADAGNRTIAATALGARLKDTAGDNVFFGMHRAMEPGRAYQVKIGVKFNISANLTRLHFYVMDPARSKVIVTRLQYNGAWTFWGANQTTTSTPIAASAECQLSINYDPVSGASIHHSSSAVYDADDGWPAEGGSWVTSSRITQLATNEIVSPRVGIYADGNVQFEVLVRNLKVRYV